MVGSSRASEGEEDDDAARHHDSYCWAGAILRPAGGAAEGGASTPTKAEGSAQLKIMDAASIIIINTPRAF